MVTQYCEVLYRRVPNRSGHAVKIGPRISFGMRPIWCPLMRTTRFCMWALLVLRITLKSVRGHWVGCFCELIWASDGAIGASLNPKLCLEFLLGTGILEQHVESMARIRSVRTVKLFQHHSNSHSCSQIVQAGRRRPPKVSTGFQRLPKGTKGPRGRQSP